MLTLRLLNLFLSDDDAPVLFEALSLAQNMLRSEGLRALSGALTFNASLRVLKLDQNAIGDDGVAALCFSLDAGRNNLEVLSLRRNDVSSDGALALANWLRTYPKLKVLDVAENNLGSGGACLLMEAVGAPNNGGGGSLEALALGSNGLGAHGFVNGVANLVMRSKSLLELDLGGNNNPTDQGLNAVAEAVLIRGNTVSGY
jgi:hypothetical protein